MEDRAVKWVYLGQPTSRGPVGRSEYRWEDEVRKDLPELQVTNCQETAQSLDQWRHVFGDQTDSSTSKIRVLCIIFLNIVNE